MVPPRRSCEPVGGFAEVAETLFVDLSCAAYGTIGTPLTGSGSGSGASSASTSASTSASRWRPASDTLEAGGAGEGESALLPSFPKLETPRTRGIVHAPLRRSSDRSAAWWRSRRSSSLTSPPSPTAWSARRSTGTGLGTASSHHLRVFRVKGASIAYHSPITFGGDDGLVASSAAAAGRTPWAASGLPWPPAAPSAWSLSISVSSSATFQVHDHAGVSRLRHLRHLCLLHTCVASRAPSCRGSPAA